MELSWIRFSWDWQYHPVFDIYTGVGGVGGSVGVTNNRVNWGGIHCFEFTRNSANGLTWYGSFARYHRRMPSDTRTLNNIVAGDFNGPDEAAPSASGAGIYSHVPVDRIQYMDTLGSKH